MQIRYSKQAENFLKKVQRKQRETIITKIHQYADDPQSLKNMVKKLQNSPFSRLRVGDYRVVFDEDGNVMLIERIETRGNVYK
ncbi:MAG TPA: hypothetical protein DD624_00985 [Alphaproteobacteria bacterium]|nr:hypothetical protein [Alphaproteobacteria bacterium]